MYRIELLLAAHGDALWLEYGDPAKPARVVIDGGPAPTYLHGLRARAELLRNKTSKESASHRSIDLFVVTHIDCDHIDGAVIFLQQAKELDIPINEIWFNAWKHLGPPSPDTFQPLQGEFLGALVAVDAELRNRWNRSFRKPAPAEGPLPGADVVAESCVMVPDAGPLPKIQLPQNATLTLLSPYRKQLERLRRQWTSAIRAFSPGDEGAALERLRQRREYRPPPFVDSFSANSYGADRSPPNGSSIAFVLQHESVRCLFAADAHARVLETSLKTMAREQGVDRLHFDAVKLSHHGSMGNISEEVLSLIQCDNWLISTNGAVFDHPDRATVELIGKDRTRPARIFCNYRAPSTVRLNPKADEAWSVVFPGGMPTPFSNPIGGLIIDLPITPEVQVAPPPEPQPEPPREAPIVAGGGTAPALEPTARQAARKRPTARKKKSLRKRRIRALRR
jgi:hypothetical protein